MGLCTVRKNYCTFELGSAQMKCIVSRGSDLSWTPRLQSDGKRLQYGIIIPNRGNVKIA